MKKPKVYDIIKIKNEYNEITTYIKSGEFVLKNFILKGNICYSKNLKEISVHKSSYVVCSDKTCAGVFDSLPLQYRQYPIFDYQDRLIIPGLVDLHIHAPQYAYRGLGMDLELIQWLEQQAFSEEAKYSDEEYAKKAYSIFCDQMKKSATTRACVFSTIHKDTTKILMQLMENSGLITFIGKVNMDQNAPDILREKSADKSYQDTVNWLNEIKGKFKNTFPILTPRFVPSCSKELFEKLGEIQKRYLIPVQSHLSENPDEIKWVKELYQDSKFYGDVYDSYALFGNGVKTVMAHCIYSTDEEIEKIKDNCVFIAHCPASNLNISSGIAPIRKYLDKNINLGLGSDVAGGQSESIFKAMVDAISVSKLYYRLCDKNSAPLTFDEAFYMATKGGGKFFGNVGSFESGYDFDAVVIDDSDLPYPQTLNVRQRLERAVYLSADIKGIYAKYCNGQKIF